MDDPAIMKPSGANGIKYVFLDRDGVLNRKLPEGIYVTDSAHFEWLPGAHEAVARMNHARVAVILVTNQRGIALGLLDNQKLQSIHATMQQDLANHGAHLDAIYYCPHDRGECHCRKPATGMFEQALQRFPESNSQNSVVIGDSLSDIEAGKRLGMTTIFILGEADRQKPGSAQAAQAADIVAVSLLDAVESYLGLHGNPKISP